MYDSNAYDAPDDATGYDGGNYNTLDTGGSTGLLRDDAVAQQKEGIREGNLFDINSGKTTKHLLPAERLAELQRRERRLAELEKDLNSKEKKMARQWRKFKGAKNWPLPFWRLAHHDLKQDIPEKHRWKVRQMYFLWILNAVAISWNWVCFFSYLVWPDKKDAGIDMDAPAGTMLIATLYVVAGIPASWLWWYKRYYNTYAGKVNKGKLGTQHFINFGIHVLYTGFMLVGIEATASGGVFIMIKVISHITALGLMFLISFVLFAIDFLAALWLIRKHRVDYGLQIVQDYVDKNSEGDTSDPRATAANYLVQQAVDNPKIAASVAKGVLQAK